MKILGGQLKGRNFYMPFGIRPTQNLLKKAVFDILGQDITGLSFLDLYAGSGAMGLEAVSRGASAVVMIERDMKCVSVIEQNFKLLNTESFHTNHVVINSDVFVAIKQFARQEKKFDIIFLDPPFDQELTKKTLKTLMTHDILHPHCFIIAQSDKRDTTAELGGRFQTMTQRKYGASILTIYTAQGHEL